jgi:hypothetical protein
MKIFSLESTKVKYYSKDRTYNKLHVNLGERVFEKKGFLPLLFFFSFLWSEQVALTLRSLQIIKPHASLHIPKRCYFLQKKNISKESSERILYISGERKNVLSKP